MRGGTVFRPYGHVLRSACGEVKDCKATRPLNPRICKLHLERRCCVCLYCRCTRKQARAQYCGSHPLGFIVDFHSDPLYFRALQLDDPDPGEEPWARKELVPGGPNLCGQPFSRESGKLLRSTASPLESNDPLTSILLRAQ